MNRLKELRKEKKLTQKELAEKTDIPYRTLQRWENGESQIKPEKAEKLANFFGVSIAHLLGYEDNDFKKQIRDDNDFEKQIKIDTLNNFLYKIHAAYVSLLEGNGDVTMTDRGFSMQGLLDENSALRDENRRLTNELMDSYPTNAKANLLDIIISEGYILKSTLDKCISKLNEIDQLEIKKGYYERKRGKKQ